MAEGAMSTRGVAIFNEQTAQELEVRDGKKLARRLTVSKGGVRWLPSGRQDPHFLATWAKFDALMQKHPRK